MNLWYAFKGRGMTEQGIEEGLTAFPVDEDEDADVGIGDAESGTQTLIAHPEVSPVKPKPKQTRKKP